MTSCERKYGRPLKELGRESKATGFHRRRRGGVEIRRSF